MIRSLTDKVFKFIPGDCPLTLRSNGTDFCYTIIRDGIAKRIPVEDVFVEDCISRNHTYRPYASIGVAR